MPPPELKLARAFVYANLFARFGLGDLVDLAWLNNQRNPILGHINANQRTIMDGSGKQKVGQFVVDLLLH